MQRPSYSIIIVLVVLTFVPHYNFQLFQSTSSTLSREQIVQNTTSLLIIYGSPDDIKTAQQLLTYRTDIAIQNITFVNWQNNTYLSTIVNDSSYLRFNEFWIIIDNINASNLPLGFVQLFVKFPTLNNIKVLFLSADINVLTTYLSNTIFSSYFNIKNCAPPINTNLSNITITYPSATNLSELLNTNTTIPNYESFTGNMTYSNCTLNSNAYLVTQLSKTSNLTYNNPITLVYQPYFKAHLVVGLFSFYYGTNQSKLANFNDFNYSSLLIKPKISSSVINQQNNTNLFFVLALLVSGQYYSQTSTSSTYPTSSSKSSSPVTNPTFDNLTINLFGLSLPQLPEWVYPTAIATGVLGLVIVILRKFWTWIAGILVFIGTLIYHPDRKLDAIEVLNHAKRQKIMDLLNIQAEHGETFRNLSEKLEMPVPTLLWHLKILQDFSFIQMFKIRRETVIVSQDYVQKFDPIIKEFELSFKSAQAQLFKTFLTNLKPNQIFTIKDVINCTKWNARTAKHHLDHLCSLKILDTTKDRNSFSINPKYNTTMKLLKGNTINPKYIKAQL